MTPRNQTDRVGVIGGGLGGLAAATTLAARGYDVVLFERNSWLGGKAAALNVEGYRFDMGPTILTMPSVLEKLFAEAGHSLQSRLDLIRLDPQWRCFFPDRPALDLVEDVEEMARRCEAFSPGLGKGYRDFMTFSGRMKTLSDRIFFWRPIESLRDMFKQQEFSPSQMLVEFVRMRQGWSVAGTVRKHVPEPHVAQMLDHFTQYVGSSPEAAPAVLCGIAGAYLSIAQSAGFIREMTAGKGYIALAALIFGKWRPLPAMGACLLFGLLDAVAIRLQGTPLPGIGEVPVQFIQALPYILTVILLAGFIGRAIPPKAIGIPYVKER